MNPKLTDRDRKEIAGWVSLNRNRITGIARELRLSPQFVHQVLYRKRRSGDGRVERKLKEAGAPVR